MKFLDQQLFLDVIQNEVRTSQLTFKVVDSNVLNFSVQLPFYLTTSQDRNTNEMNSLISELDNLNAISFD